MQQELLLDGLSEPGKEITDVWTQVLLGAAGFRRIQACARAEERRSAREITCRQGLEDGHVKRPDGPKRRSRGPRNFPEAPRYPAESRRTPAPATERRPMDRHLDAPRALRVSQPPRGWRRTPVEAGPEGSAGARICR